MVVLAKQKFLKQDAKNWFTLALVAQCLSKPCQDTPDKCKNLKQLPWLQEVKITSMRHSTVMNIMGSDAHCHPSQRIFTPWAHCILLGLQREYNHSTWDSLIPLGFWDWMWWHDRVGHPPRSSWNSQSCWWFWVWPATALWRSKSLWCLQTTSSGIESDRTAPGVIVKIVKNY